MLFSLMLTATLGCGDSDDHSFIYVNARQFEYPDQLYAPKGESFIVTFRYDHYHRDAHGMHYDSTINPNEAYWTTNDRSLRLEPHGSFCIVTSLSNRVDGSTAPAPISTLKVEYRGISEVLKVHHVSNLAGVWRFVFNGERPTVLILEQAGRRIGTYNYVSEHTGHIDDMGTMTLMYEGRRLIGKIESATKLSGTYTAEHDRSGTWSSGSWTAEKAL